MAFPTTLHSKKTKNNLQKSIFLVFKVLFVTCLLFSSFNSKAQNNSLQKKIEQAIATRKVPVVDSSSKVFNPASWVSDRGRNSPKVFSHLEDYLPTIGISKGNTQTKFLPKKINPSIGDLPLKNPFLERVATLNEMSDKNEVSGIIILHKGQIVYERYPDMQPEDRHFFASVSKLVLGTVIANLADEGKLSEQDTLGKYLKELRGTPLGKVTIENTLRMGSGINCREYDRGSFTDPNHCFYKLLQYSAVIPGPSKPFEQNLMELFSEKGIIKENRRPYDYTSANSLILSAVAERAAQKPYHQLLSEIIWSKIGAEDDARITMSEYGVAGSFGMILARLRDLARYGLAFTEDASNKIVSDAYFKKLTKEGHPLYRTRTARMFENQGAKYQNYHVDIAFDDGDLYKSGLGGQGVYVSPKKRLVIAYFSSNKFDNYNNYSMDNFVRSVALLDVFKADEN